MHRITNWPTDTFIDRVIQQIAQTPIFWIHERLNDQL